MKIDIRSFVCAKQLQINEKECDDFEVRFCCREKLTNGSLSTTIPTTTLTSPSSIMAISTTEGISSIESYLLLINEKIPKNISELRKLNCKLSRTFSEIVLNSVQSFNISTASSIGLECESGKIDDCNLSLTTEVLPAICGDKRIFSTNNEQQCGSECSFKNLKFKSKRSGWTKYARLIHHDKYGP